MRVAYFEKLDFFHTIIAIFLRIFLIKVVYREIDKKVNNKKILKILFFFKIKNINFFLTNDNFFKGHQNLDIFENKLIKLLNDNRLVRNFINSEFKNKDKDIVNRAICNSFGNLKIWPSTFYYFQKKLNKNKIIYFPQNIESAVILQIFKLNNVFVFPLKIYISILISFFRKKNTSQKKVKKDIKTNILYFPHQGILYGKKIFKKNFLYKDLKIRDKILTIYYDEIIKFDSKYYSLYKLKYEILYKNNIYNSFFKIFFKSFYKTSKNNFLLLDLKILNFIKEYHFKKRFLGNYPNLKMSYIFFEEIFEDYPLILAFKNKNIKILSHSERLALSTFVYSPRIIDHYFIPSKGAKEMLIKRKYLIKKYHIVGFMRTALAMKKNNINFKKLPTNNKKIILCLTVGYTTKIGASVYGDRDGTKTSFDYFIKLIFKLSIIHKNFLFVIKPKFSWEKPYIEKLIKTKNQLNNILIFDEGSPYKLASEADLVISKYTSLIDEILPLGKPVLHVDETKVFTDQPLFIKHININANTFNEVINKINFFKKNKNYYDIKNSKNITYYFGNSKKNVSNEICKFIKNSL